MNNIPKVKVGIVAVQIVSESLSVNRRKFSGCLYKNMMPQTL